VNFSNGPGCNAAFRNPAQLHRPSTAAILGYVLPRDANACRDRRTSLRAAHLGARINYPSDIAARAALGHAALGYTDISHFKDDAASLDIAGV
jgi:hypothetical protein